MTVLPTSLVCPRCRRDLERRPQAYRCARCGLIYPIVCGIPDLRLRSDRYLSVEAERAKAEALHRLAKGASLEALVAHYYAITDDVPPMLAARYIAYVRSAPERARSIVDDLAPDPGMDRLIDLGCGTGGLVAAASSRCRAVVGLDIALRWLVIARKRLEELGVDAELVCADVETPPFPDDSFSQGVAADLIEHVYDPGRALGAIRRLLQPGGTVWLSAINRYCPGPHPSTGVWGVGYLPAAWRRAIRRKLRGIDSLRYTHLVSPGAAARLCRQQGLEVMTVRPRRVDTAAGAERLPLERTLLAGYRALHGRPWLSPVLVRLGPGFEILCRRPALQAASAEGARDRCVSA